MRSADGSASLDPLYGPSYYPVEMVEPMKPSMPSSGAALHSSDATKLQQQQQQHNAALRQRVPYLKDLHMSVETLVYQPPSSASGGLSKMMSLGVKAIAGITKSISFAVPQAHSAIYEWDDGSALRRASSVSPMPGNKPLPSITVSCEEGPFARNFYELRQNREGAADNLSSEIDTSFVNQLGVADPSDATLAVPVWLERAATPEEIAVERHFAMENPKWDSLYWQGLEDSRRRELHRMRMDERDQQQQQQSAARRSGGGTGAFGHSTTGSSYGLTRTTDPTPFARSGSTATESSQQQQMLPASHGLSIQRKSSIPVIRQNRSTIQAVRAESMESTPGTAKSQQQGVAGGGAGVGVNPQSGAQPRWNASGRLENSLTFRRETTGSSASSLFELQSQSSGKGSSVRELRRNSLAAGGAGAAGSRTTKMGTTGSNSTASNSTRPFKIVSVATSSSGGNTRLKNADDVAMRPNRSPPPAKKASQPPHNSEDISPARILSQDLDAEAAAAVLPAVSLERTLSSTHSTTTAEPSEIGGQSSWASKTDASQHAGVQSNTIDDGSEDHREDYTNNNSMLLRSTNSGFRPPIPWSSEWAMPCCLVRRLHYFVPSKSLTLGRQSAASSEDAVVSISSSSSSSDTDSDDDARELDRTTCSPLLRSNGTDSQHHHHTKEATSPSGDNIKDRHSSFKTNEEECGHAASTSPDIAARHNHIESSSSYSPLRTQMSGNTTRESASPTMTIHSSTAAATNKSGSMYPPTEASSMIVTSSPDLNRTLSHPIIATTQQTEAKKEVVSTSSVRSVTAPAERPKVLPSAEGKGSQVVPEGRKTASKACCAVM